LAIGVSPRTPRGRRHGAGPVTVGPLSFQHQWTDFQGPRPWIGSRGETPGGFQGGALVRTRPFVRSTLDARTNPCKKPRLPGSHCANPGIEYQMVDRTHGPPVRSNMRGNP